MHIKIFLQTFLFILIGIFSCEASLDLYLFNVGHGNFILLKNDDNALIVDAGSKDTKWEDIEGTFKECLGKSTLKCIIKTHNHEDHINFLSNITVSDATIIYSYKDFSLGELSVSFLQPKQPLTGLPGNDQSLVFSVSYKNKNILFTGDATGSSFTNYLSQFDDSDGVRVNKNRNIIAETTIYIMPHHGSSDEDSWQWTNFLCKWCSNLTASFICCNPETDSYFLPQEWIRHIPWPASMHMENQIKLKYHLEKTPFFHEATTDNRLYLTGLAKTYNPNTPNYLHLNIDDNGTITYPEGYNQDKTDTEQPSPCDTSFLQPISSKKSKPRKRRRESSDYIKMPSLKKMGKEKTTKKPKKKAKQKSKEQSIPDEVDISSILQN